jgi:dipeptidyl aminopeptidase/acylaminoacyl peptidase
MSRPRQLLSICTCSLLFLTVLLAVRTNASAQDAPQRRSPNAVCIQPVDDPQKAVWVTVPDHHYLGSPAFSPDGQWVAFDAYKSVPRRVVPEIWIVRVDGSDLKRITTGATPRWSQDGERLLFMREKRNETEKGPFEVFVIGRDGTDEHRICDGLWPDWSPDGKRIVFSVGVTDDRGGTQKFARVYIANADGTEKRLLADGDNPCWSPDGRKIACSYYDPAFPAPMVRIIDLETDRQRFVGVGWFRPNWTADSNSVVVTGVTADRKAGPVQLSVMEARPRPVLLSEIDGGASPCFSADGKLLVFAAPHPNGD